MKLQEVGDFSKFNNFYKYTHYIAYPSVLRSGIEVSGLVVLLVGIPPGAGISVYYECCVRSGRDLWVGLINSPDGS